MTQRKVCYVHFITRQMKYQWLLRDRSEYILIICLSDPLEAYDKYMHGKVDTEAIEWCGGMDGIVTK